MVEQQSEAKMDGLDGRTAEVRQRDPGEARGRHGESGGGQLDRAIHRCNNAFERNECWNELDLGLPLGVLFTLILFFEC